MKCILESTNFLNSSVSVVILLGLGLFSKCGEKILKLSRADKIYLQLYFPLIPQIKLGECFYFFVENVICVKNLLS